MINDAPFLRQVEVLIGPLPEWKGGGDEKMAARFYGDGSPSTLRIKFTVRKHIITTASSTLIEIYNLGPDVRAALRASEARVILRVGWQSSESDLVEIYRGSVLQSTHVRDGADIVTTVMGVQGFSGLNRAVVSDAWAPGTPLRTIVLSLAAKIPGVSVDAGRVDVRSASMGYGGWSYAGSVAEGLDRLARVYGFSWGVDDGMFFALDDSKSRPGLLRLTPATGLKRIEPVLVAPFQSQSGVSISSVLNPQIQLGTEIEVESGVNPLLNGRYKITTLEHAGGTHETQWDTTIESMLTGKEIELELQRIQEALSRGQ